MCFLVYVKYSKTRASNHCFIILRNTFDCFIFFLERSHLSFYKVQNFQPTSIERYELYPLIILTFRFRCLITACDCLISLHFRFSIPFLCSFVFLGFSLRVWGFSSFCWVTPSPFSEPLFSSFLSLLFSFLRDGSNENDLQPSPNIDYRALYPWASAELLVETSTLNSSEDVRKHREGEPDCVRHVFGRESDTYVSVRPCAKGEPVCADDRANEGEPFFFLYQTIFKQINLRLPLIGFERALLTKLTWPPPSCIPTTGPSRGPSLSCATTSGTLPQSTSSSTSSRPRARGRISG